MINPSGPCPSSGQSRDVGHGLVWMQAIWFTPVEMAAEGVWFQNSLQNKTRAARPPPGIIVSHRGNIFPIGCSHHCCADMGHGLDFESVVAHYYEPLYQFAFSLTHSEADACDLTQETFYVWATKGHQLRDESKVKTWLFTTLHRQFLQSRRRQVRFPHEELEAAKVQLPTVAPIAARQIDARQALAALQRVDDVYRAPLALFYLDDTAYKNIAEILEIPLGTVKSRIARGIAQLQTLLAEDPRTRKSGGEKP